jgi:hypothetical protein
LDFEEVLVAAGFYRKGRNEVAKNATIFFESRLYERGQETSSLVIPSR